mmetsp:Transcript_32676/g.101812  ORF Transcript_32676/g.101812 Transcript_32676/m.101812 type:complete len:130 (-) Transcript_32676:598-987(-)
MTITWVARATVLMRWAMMMDVRRAMTRPSASCSWCSVCESSALVASSSRSTGGSFSTVRAMATRCFWPPESAAPALPTSVSRPAGRPEAKSMTLAVSAASMSSASVARGLPYLMLSRMEPLKSLGSCST